MDFMGYLCIVMFWLFCMVKDELDVSVEVVWGCGYVICDWGVLSGKVVVSCYELEVKIWIDKKFL